MGQRIIKKITLEYSDGYQAYIAGKNAREWASIIDSYIFEMVVARGREGVGHIQWKKVKPEDWKITIHKPHGKHIEVYEHKKKKVKQKKV